MGTDELRTLSSFNNPYYAHVIRILQIKIQQRLDGALESDELFNLTLLVAVQIQQTITNSRMMHDRLLDKDVGVVFSNIVPRHYADEHPLGELHSLVHFLQTVVRNL